MEKLQLQPSETLIGKGQVAYHEKVLITSRAYDGHIYVTDQRVCFYIRMLKDPTMNFSLSEIEGFSVGKKALFTSVTIHGKSGEKFVFTGLPIKKVQEWLRQAGVHEL